MTKKKPRTRASHAYPSRLNTDDSGNQNPTIKAKKMKNLTDQRMSKNPEYNDVPKICRANIIANAMEHRSTADSPS